MFRSARLLVLLATIAILAVSGCSSAGDGERQKADLTRSIQAGDANTQRLLNTFVSQKKYPNSGVALPAIRERLIYNTAKDANRIFASAKRGRDEFSLSVFYPGLGSVAGFEASWPPFGYLCMRYSINIRKRTVDPREISCPKKLLLQFPEVIPFRVHPK